MIKSSPVKQFVFLEYEDILFSSDIEMSTSCNSPLTYYCSRCLKKLHFLERVWMGTRIFGMTISNIECFSVILVFEMFTSDGENSSVSAFKI
jgi:hypothetical protein